MLSSFSRSSQTKVAFQTKTSTLVPSAKRFSSAAPAAPTFEHLKVTRYDTDHVVHIELDRPKKSNALNGKLWEEIRTFFENISHDPKCRVIVISGSGKNFTAGLDLDDAGKTLLGLAQQEGKDVSRKAFAFNKLIKSYQDSFTAIEQCRQPVIAAVHGACIGAGVDLITACDIRYGSGDSYYSIKEVDIGLAADVGTLQRFPKVVGAESLLRELAYTSRLFSSKEAKEIGLISKLVEEGKEKLIEETLSLARVIGTKSPVAVAGTKRALIYSRDHPVAASLDWQAAWNMSMLQSADIVEAVSAQFEKSSPKFDDLS
eukprot:TRINITY_DN3119_c0_g1_i1.p1 TRINITY_DN3119_c0_g1~~TRINITY_DN3119_c0_g1_i1.p1  ORF type:complete len:316 (+),score=84.37 TRINITY_DN3119_c0_g1_i1:1153-2100(+)